jgi:predicted metal-dependent peptidase
MEPDVLLGGSRLRNRWLHHLLEYKVFKYFHLGGILIMSSAAEDQIVKPQAEEKFATRETIEDMLELDTITLLKKEPFYAYLLVKMHKKIDNHVPVAAIAVIDGDIILYINEFGYASLTRKERVAVLKHEILHVIMVHYLRRRDRDPELFNIAADIAINQMINTEHFHLPNFVIYPHHYNLPEGKTAEEYYKILWNRNEQIEIPEELKEALAEMLANSQGNNQGQPQQGQGGQGQGQNGQGDEEEDPNGQPQQGQGQGQGQSQGSGNGRQSGSRQGSGRASWAADMHPTWDRSTDVSDDVAEAIVRSLVQEAYDKSQGKVPGEISALISEILSSKLNWRAIFRNFVAKARHTNKKSTWKRPNRRLDRQVMGYKKHKRLSVYVFIDTSGSVGGKELEMFNGELQKMHQTGTEITVIECDAAVQSVYKYKKNLQPTFKGRGGTDFRPPFKYVTEHNERPDCIIYLTDGYGHAPAEWKQCPVLWVLTPQSQRPLSDDGGEVRYGGQITLED